MLAAAGRPLLHMAGTGLVAYFRMNDEQDKPTTVFGKTGCYISLFWLGSYSRLNVTVHVPWESRYGA